jgi:DNA-binding NtrC family response regulator
MGHLVTAIVVCRTAFPESLRRDLDALGVRCVSPEHAADADAVLTDPDGFDGGIDVLCAELAREYPHLPIIVVGDGQMQSAVQALRAGASDYVDRAAAPTDIANAVARARFETAIRTRRRGLTPLHDEGGLLGESSAVVRLREELTRAADSDVTVVLIGESGTGKELAARHLHSSGPRRRAPFVAVDCASIPNGLAESELFGYVKGAFSGAQSSHPGLLRAAHGGTLFLDDIGALTPALQAKLLRSLQQRSVRAVGSDEEIATDFRLVVSSVVPPEELVESGQLRSDLYYRLAVLEIRLPPLRERDLDALLLAEVFYDAAAKRSGKQIVGMTPAFEEALLRYGWPGNVRELRNAIEYAVAVTRFDHLGAQDLPRTVRSTEPPAETQGPDTQRWEATERSHIEDVLRRVGGNRTLAAELLGIDRKTLHRKIDRFGIDIPSRSGSGVRTKGETPEPPGQSSRYRFSFR